MELSPFLFIFSGVFVLFCTKSIKKTKVDIFVQHSFTQIAHIWSFQGSCRESLICQIRLICQMLIPCKSYYITNLALFQLITYTRFIWKLHKFYFVLSCSISYCFVLFYFIIYYPVDFMDNRENQAKNNIVFFAQSITGIFKQHAQISYLNRNIIHNWTLL